MSPLHLGFGIEIEAAVEPLFMFYGQKTELVDAASYYAKLADDLRKDGTPAEADDCVRYIKNHDYTKWWITRDGSVKPEDGCIAMEIVSPVLKSYENWEEQMIALWDVVKVNFKVHKNETAGTHVHVAPIDRSFKLREMKAIAFACSYYEPYVLSILPYERRNHKYCNRNSNATKRMGALVRSQSVCGIWTLREEINSLESVEQVCEFMQGGMKKEHRYVLWNFQNLARRTGTIEFRGGRHLRGPVKTIWWTTFVIVFVSMAIDQNLVLNGPPEQIPQYYEAGRGIERFWRSVLRHADSLVLGANLPEDYRMMSGEMSEDEGSTEEEEEDEEEEEEEDEEDEEDEEESDSEDDLDFYIEESYDNRW